jgi:putative ABC transport system permease protein
MTAAAAAFRALGRNPTFTAAAILTISLGIGATAAIFSVVDAVLLRPLPVPALDRVLVVRGDVPVAGLTDVPLAPAEVLDLAERGDLFEGVTGYTMLDRTLTGLGDPARVSIAATVGDFGRVFGITPYLGHLHGAEQSVEGPFHTVVLSHGIWRQLSGGDAGFLGSTLELDGVAHEVVGVMPPGFQYPRGAQAWAPFQLTDRFRQPMGRNIWIMTAVARANPGLEPSVLEARLAAESERWRAEYSPGAETGKLLTTTGLAEHVAGPLRPVVLVLFGAVALVMLMVAANVASLQLVRATARRRELAVRAALGASGRKLGSQLLAESLILAAAGAAGGLALASLALELFTRWTPAQQMHLGDLALDGVVLAFTAAVAGATALAFGTAPALRAARTNPHHALADAGRHASAGGGRNRFLRVNVATQIALSVVLLLGSGLMVRTLANALATDPGFRAADVVTAQVILPRARYGPGEALTGFFSEVVEGLRATPGVEHAALVWGLPFTDQVDSSPFRVPGREPPSPGEPQWHAETRVVSDGYFAAMGIPVLRGRDFDGTERDGGPIVAVVDRTFADRYFPGEEAVGQRFESGFFGMEEATVIGVVGATDHQELGAAGEPVIYYSYRQQSWWPWRSLVVRSALPPAAVAGMMRATVAGIDPDVPLYDVQTMGSRIEHTLAPRRIIMTVLSGFAALALALAALGVYGVLRYTTAQRLREMGIRIAIGARPRDINRLILGQGMATTAVGILVGLAAGLVLVRFLSGILYGVQPYDPGAFIAAAIIVSLVAALACWLPARRAGRVDPLSIVRNE